MLSKILWKLSCICLVALPLSAQAAELWETGGMATFCAALPGADGGAVKSRLNRHVPAIKQDGN